MRMESLPEFPHGVGQYAAETWADGHPLRTRDTVADEVPVALVYNGISHAVMLATPHDLEDFALGFSLSEGIVASLAEIRDCEVAQVDNGVAVEMTIASDRFVALKERRRNLAGRTGCGLCGTESLDQVFRPLPHVGRGLELDIGSLYCAAGQLKDRQPLHALTGAIHAAAWGRADGELTLVREDVGRHNALDKLIGAMVRQSSMAFDDGFVPAYSAAPAARWCKRRRC